MAESRIARMVMLAKVNKQEHVMTINQHFPIRTIKTHDSLVVVDGRNVDIDTDYSPGIVQTIIENNNNYDSPGVSTARAGSSFSFDVDINDMIVLDENLVPLQKNTECDNNNHTIDMFTPTNEVIVMNTTSGENKDDNPEREDSDSENEESRLLYSDADYEPNNSQSNNDDSSNESDNNGSQIHTEIARTNDKNQSNGESSSNANQEQEFTKRGTVRKRKKKSKKESKELSNLKKMRKEQDNHKIQLPCSEVCKRRCRKNISETRRHWINSEFWKLNWSERRMFVLHNTRKMDVKRRSKDSTCATSRRKETITYHLKNERGEVYQVCKVFFLTTLGFTKKNDTIVKHVLHHNKSDVAVSKDMRGKHAKHVKYDRDLLQNHIQQYHPCVSHYRREHAPNKLYLPSDVTMKGMHEDFKKEFPDTKCSYELYRHVVVKEMNISFAHLGHEECEICENHKLHDVSHSRENLSPNCEICKSWQVHKKKYTKARETYKEDVEKSKISSDTLFYSADLQKVIMLPRLDMFKSVIFTPRIIAFNESFVPLGTHSQQKTVATIWHEAVAGRKKEDIISSFHQFFILHRDCKKLVVWLDNCSAQNKNWTLMSFLIYIINSTEVDTEEICLKYFEKGHTFMSADSFHHQVEMALKAKKKVYDFPDFRDCIATANSGRVLVKEMIIEDFSLWSDHASQTALKKINPRPYLSEMTEVKVVRGSRKLMYKKEFEGDYTEIDFLKKKFAKGIIPKPPSVQNYRGITSQKKDKLLKEISGLMPASRLNFWKNLPVSETATDLITNFQ